jgi:hypothetical protein
VECKTSRGKSPWNYPLYWGHAIIERPLAGEVGEQAGVKHILGNVLPSFRTSYNSTLTYKRLTMYAS